MSSIQAENIQVSYDNRIIIDELSTSIPKGSITTIIGANGCGKSTLLKALTRIIPVQEGAIYLDGQAISQLPTKEVAKKLALLPQVLEATEGFPFMNWSPMVAFRIKMGWDISLIRIERKSTGPWKSPGPLPTLGYQLMIYQVVRGNGFGLRWHLPKIRIPFS